jgi:hypothetical protein
MQRQRSLPNLFLGKILYSRHISVGSVLRKHFIRKHLKSNLTLNDSSATNFNFQMTTVATLLKLEGGKFKFFR